VRLPRAAASQKRSNTGNLRAHFNDGGQRLSMAVAAWQGVPVRWEPPVYDISHSASEEREAELLKLPSVVLELLTKNVNALLEAVRALDTDKSGDLSQEEFVEGMSRLCKITLEEALQMYTWLDDDGSGSVSVTEVYQANRVCNYLESVRHKKLVDFSPHRTGVVVHQREPSQVASRAPSPRLTRARPCRVPPPHHSCTGSGWRRA